MKTSLGVVVALALGALLANYLLAENGYVLISLRGYVIEMSVPIAVALLAVAYLAVRLMIWVWRAPRRLGEATARIRLRWSARQATRGYIALAAGDLMRGERLLTRNARQSGAPLLNYLAAARLAHQQNDRSRRDSWLQLALQQEPAAVDAVLLTEAEMLLEEGSYDRARAALEKVIANNPKHGQALRLLGELHWRAGQWETLAALLPDLRNSPRIPAERLQRWTLDAYTALLGREGLDTPAIGKRWDEVPKPLRRDPTLVRAWLGALIRSGATQAADTEIRRQLQESWDPALVLLYGELKLSDVSRQLKNAEAFLRDHPQDPDLLLVVGRLSFRNQLWGKARSYLETSLAVRPTPVGYQALGALMHKIGDEAAATRAFQRGLDLLGHQAPPPRIVGAAAGAASAATTAGAP